MKSIIGEKMNTLCLDKNLSIHELAERSGLSAQQIELMINSDNIPSLSALIKIARALGVRLGTFLDDSKALGPVIHRKEDVTKPATCSSQLSTTNSHLDFFSLAASKTGRHMEPFIIDIKPFGEEECTYSSHEGEEFIFVMEGSIKVSYGKETHILQAGDSIYYDSIVSHLICSTHNKPARFLAVVYSPF